LLPCSPRLLENLNEVSPFAEGVIIMVANPRATGPFSVRLLSLGLLVVACLCSRSIAQSCTPPTCWTGNFYQYEIVAQNNESVDVGTLTGFGNSPSVNEFGEVAFVGQVSQNNTPLGDTLFFGNPGSNALTDVAPNFLTTSRTFDDAVQINDTDQIVTNDRFAGSPPVYFIRVWNGHEQNSFTLVAKSGSTFAAVLTDATINSSNAVTFSALNSNFNGLLVESDPPYSQLNQVSLNTPLRPMIADDGSSVVRGGNTDTSPIIYYSPHLKSPLTIADTSEFSALGQSPGISRDGKVIAFAGNLVSTGNWDNYAGPGVFVAILDKGQVAHQMRVAGFHFGNKDGIKQIAASCVGSDEANCKGGRYFPEEGSPWCDPADIKCLTGAELEDLPPFSKPIPVYFNTFTAAGFQNSTEWENRIAVINREFGGGETIVVSFIATPNMDDKKGWGLFSANQGIWTVRADLFDTPSFGFFAHVYRPIPVIQIGDTLGTTGLSVTGLSVYDQLANAAVQEANGDHALGFWVSTSNSGQMILRSSYIPQYGSSGWNAADCCESNGKLITGKGAGTLGALVSASGTNLILSNDHVMGIPLSRTKNGAKVGNPISAPGPRDYACRKPHTVGMFSAAPVLSKDIDAAVATLNDGEINTTGQIYGIGIPSNTIAQPQVGMTVAKQGRSSGLTCGKIVSVAMTTPPVPYHLCAGEPFKVTFKNQVVAESGDLNHPFDLEGDSGSLIVTQGTAQPVALLFAGGVDVKNHQEASIANPISAVASQLGITFVGGPMHSVNGCHGTAGPMLSLEEEERVRLVKEKYEADLLRDSAVVGVGVGAADENPEKGVILILIQEGDHQRPIPPFLDGIRTKLMVMNRVRPASHEDCSPTESVAQHQ
jgi:hypothetical protein